MSTLLAFFMAFCARTPANAQSAFNPALVTVTASFATPTVVPGGTDLLTITAKNANPPTVAAANQVVSTSVTMNYSYANAPETATSNAASVTVERPGADTTAQNVSVSLVLPLWLAEVHVTGIDGQSRSSTDATHYLATLNLPTIHGGQTETATVLLKATP